MAGVTLAAAVAAVFLLRYRRRTDAIPLTPRVHAPLWLEVVVYGGLLALFCVWWVIGFLQYRVLQTPPPDAIPIYVTAKQWMWKFAYPQGADVVGRALRAGRPPGQADHDLARRDPQLLRRRRSGSSRTWSPAARSPRGSRRRARHVRRAVRRVLRHRPLADARPGRRAGPRRLRALARRPPHAPLALPGAKGDGQGLAERGRADRRRARLPALPHRSTARRTSARPGPASIGSRRATADGRQVVADEAYLTESMMDPARGDRRRLPAGDAVVPGRADARPRPRRSSSSSARCATSSRPARCRRRPARSRSPPRAVPPPRRPAAREPAHDARSAAPRRRARLPARRARDPVVADHARPQAHRAHVPDRDHARAGARRRVRAGAAHRAARRPSRTHHRRR